MRTKEEATREARQKLESLQEENFETATFLRDELTQSLAESADFESAEAAYELLREAERKIEEAREELGWLTEGE